MDHDITKWGMVKGFIYLLSRILCKYKKMYFLSVLIKGLLT